MKKILKFIAPLLLLLSSCGVSNFEKDTTVILDVTTNVTPSFSANFGEGTYQDNVYTHHVNWRKDLYIYLSYEGLATQTVFIPADEMSSSTIRKSVVFGNSLSTVVTITADNIDDISLAKIETNNKLVDTKYDAKKKKIVKLTFEGRDTDLDITLKLDGYKDTNIHIDKSKLAGGIYNLNQTFAKENETVLTLLNTWANIYEYPSGKKVKDISSWNDNMVNKILDTDKTYYVNYSDANGNSRVKLIDKKNGLFIEGNNSYSQDQGRLGWLNIYYNRDNGSGESSRDYISFYIVNTIDHEIYTSHDLYEKYLNSHSYAIIFNSWTQDYSGWFIIPDMSALNYIKEGDKYNSEYSYTIPSLENLDRINFIDEIYDLLEPTKKLREENYFYGGTNRMPYELRDNTYVVKTYGLDSSKRIYTKIVDEKDEFLFDTSFPFDSLTRYNEELQVKGKDREVTINFIEDLITFDKDNDCYRYPSVMVDTSTNYIRVYNGSRGGWVNFDTVYDKTADEFVATKDNTYFEGKADHNYILYTWESATEITLTAEDVETGIYVTGTKYDYLLNVPEGYSLTLDTYNPLKIFYEDTDGHTHLITNKNQDGNMTLNEIVLSTEGYSINCNWMQVNQNNIKNNTIDFTPIINYGAFNHTSMDSEFNSRFATARLKFDEYPNRNSDIVVFSNEGIDSENPFSLGTLQNLNETSVLELSTNDLAFNSQYNAISLDKSKYRIIVRDWRSGDGRNSVESCLDPNTTYRIQYTNNYVVSKDSSITVDGVTVNLADIDSLYVDASCLYQWDDMTYEWKYTDLKVVPLDTTLKVANTNYWEEVAA